MKRLLSSLFSKLPRDNRGATAVIYALCLLPLLLLVGFAIDASRVELTKKHMQDSVDAAVLAGAREFLMQAGLTAANRKTMAGDMAQEYYLSDIAQSLKDLKAPAISVGVSDIGIVTANVNADLPLIFGGFFGKSDVNIKVNGAAQAGDSRKVEVILALDNTTSMFDDDRFTKMREAAKGFVDEMFDQTPAADLMAIGVVPWASVVNIKSEAPLGWNASPAGAGTPPVYGSGKIAPAAFEGRRKYLYDPEAEIPYTAAQMAEDFSPVEWRGCIRSAPNERRVTSGGVVSAKLTDAAVPGMRWHASWLEPENHTHWIWKPSPPKPPKPPTTGPKPPKPPKPPSPPPPGPQGSLTPDYLSPPGVPVISQAAISVPSGRNYRCTQDKSQFGYEGARNVYLQEDTPCASGPKSGIVGIAKACVSDPTEHKYFANGGKACAWEKDIFPWDSYKAVSGPNMNCPTAMLGLSGDRRQIMDKLDHMYPVQGGTQADIGLMWGLRALSPRPTWVNFFGHKAAQAPKSYNDPDVRKIMILLTDGKNEVPYHYEGYYGCNEGNTRWSAGPCWKAKGVKSLTRSSLDSLTLDSCEAIREDYGIELYTIAVDISDAGAIKLLGDCVNDPTRTFNITSSQLDKTFSTIAARELRLTQ